MAKRKIITSAQACASPHRNFLKGLETYCENNDAEIIVLPMIGQSAKEDIDELHPFFDDYNVEEGEPKLNNNFSIRQFNVRPYQIDPLTGLSRFVQRETSVIFASPKQRLMPIPHSNHKIPKFLMTPGACTKPNYATGTDVSAERRRIGNIAQRDHILGAMVVEIEDENLFHFRNLRANSRGEFVDLGRRYNAEEIVEANLEAMVAGDYHMGESLPEVLEATYKMIEMYKPRRLVLHDFFNGHSVSHWIDCEKAFIETKIIQQLDKNQHILERELKEDYDELMKLDDLMEGRPIYLVACNHHNFLNRYLNEGRFMKDSVNARVAFKLASYMAEKDYNDPVEAGLRMIGKVPSNIHFLKRDEDLKVRGYQLGVHGDYGPGGGRGSMMSKENDFGRSITGHVHKAQILRDTYTMGTCLPLTPYYMRGQPTSFTNTHALLWDNSSVQLINILNGKWKMER